METAWIQVFVLTLSECIAPAGKTVCQEREFEMPFVEEAACEMAMEQMLWLADGAPDVIINRDKTGCSAAAIERPVFASADDVQVENAPVRTVQSPTPSAQVDDFTQSAHKQRLADMKTCDESNGVTPCRVGEIIIEGASEQQPQVWKRNP